MIDGNWLAYNYEIYASDAAKAMQGTDKEFPRILLDEAKAIAPAIGFERRAGVRSYVNALASAQPRNGTRCHPPTSGAC